MIVRPLISLVSILFIVGAPCAPGQGSDGSDVAERSDVTQQSRVPIVGTWAGNDEDGEVVEMSFSAGGEFVIAVDDEGGSGKWKSDTTQDPPHLDISIEGHGVIKTIWKVGAEGGLLFQDNQPGEPRPKAFDEDALLFTKKDPAELELLDTSSSDGSGDDASDERSVDKIDIYITPIYDSKGPKISVGKYSKGLASPDEKEFLKTIAAMKAAWEELTVEQLYVAAIQLYDRGYRDVAVYWYYSGQLRSKVIMRAVDAGHVGTPSAELLTAQAAAVQLVGPYMNGYAFGRPEMLTDVIKRVQADGDQFPDLAACYPQMKFATATYYQDQIDAVVEGLDGLLEVISEQGDSIRQQRIESGANLTFDALTSKDLPQ